jgi:hypothetical protein
VIDGDANVFDQSYFREGERGGYAAGQTLAKGVAEYLTALNGLRLAARISFWVPCVIPIFIPNAKKKPLDYYLPE